MPKITFLPMNITVEAQAGESVLDAALDHDIPIQHVCGGFCACTTCHIEVRDGIESFSPMDEDEQERVERVPNSGLKSRLACQAKLTNRDVIVEVQNVEDY